MTTTDLLDLLFGQGLDLNVPRLAGLIRVLGLFHAILLLLADEENRVSIGRAAASARRPPPRMQTENAVSGERRSAPAGQ